MAESPDRRVRRTRDLLHRALIELMIERGYERVTVTDVIDRADVGRSTFYAHYRDKDDLLVVSCTEFLRREIARVRAVPGSPLAPLRVMFQLAADYPDVYQPLIGPKSGATVLRAYQQSVRSILAEQLAGRLDMDDGEFSDTVAFLSWGVIGLLGSVIDPRAPTPPSTAWRRFEALCTSGLGSRLGRTSLR
ncbi:TetR/AcrR family transcriptional regulator [Nocardia cyriacigeorgica]|uniref:TetR/AcrR family transcriptional regulator n=1 Tax=Nocardia cyriacigeorgica TaxID=135487 RepID=UPI0013D3E293|nr:TetR/AcrR family transcriptional regulator [Nocardia cyriacigeorgica]MBF6455584.1 TetR/AcrR family transcriptional regulator [Nocardia cyriacigeorgica]MBF6479537.1 TetR/AcrR family transcriptional regulator [Nocardia cyriacigeorgica]MBF6553674.1 TetR/AcrR family transcriptional regulator [Nocardia cyriacigeorgica]NEW28235.1 TetR/AcrR family transcriptional regulator [Nocardia cyriacigeorgica]